MHIYIYTIYYCQQKPVQQIHRNIWYRSALCPRKHTLVSACVRWHTVCCIGGASSIIPVQTDTKQNLIRMHRYRCLLHSATSCNHLYWNGIELYLYHSKLRYYFNPHISVTQKTLSLENKSSTTTFNTGL